MLRMRAVVAAAAVVLLVAGGCTKDEPEPNFSSVSTGATPTASPTSSAPTPVDSANVPSGAASPTLPSGAAENTSDGAFAFVSHYWREVDWAYSIADGDVLAGLFRASCSSCASSRKSINDVRDKGNSFRGGHLAIASQTLADPSSDPDANYAIDTVLAVDMLTEVDASGAEVASYPPATYTVRAFVAWSDDRFEVTATSNIGSS